MCQKELFHSNFDFKAKKSLTKVLHKTIPFLYNIASSNGWWKPWRLLGKIDMLNNTIMCAYVHWIGLCSFAITTCMLTLLCMHCAVLHLDDGNNCWPSLASPSSIISMMLRLLYMYMSVLIHKHINFAILQVVIPPEEKNLINIFVDAYMYTVKSFSFFI